MFKRPALVITLALILTAVLTLAFSPDARAAVKALLTFNGVTVTLDEETGKLVVTGNTDAVIEQTDNSVMIQGENNEVAGVAVISNAGEMIAVSEVLASTPGLVLPKVPDGYSLQPEAQRLEDGTLMFTWTNDSKNFITYQRSPNKPLPVLQGVVGSSGAPIEMPEGSATEQSVEVIEGSALLVEGQVIPSGDIVQLPTYEWEAGGYYHSLFAQDSALTIEDLKAMAP